MRFRLVCRECFELVDLLPPVGECLGPLPLPNYRHAFDGSELCPLIPEDDAPARTPWTWPGPIMAQVDR